MTVAQKAICKVFFGFRTFGAFFDDSLTAFAARVKVEDKIGPQVSPKNQSKTLFLRFRLMWPTVGEMGEKSQFDCFHGNQFKWNHVNQ